MMGEVEYHEGRFPHHRETLFYRVWRPASCHTALIIIHGFGEHGGRYEGLVRLFAEQGIAVACHDLIGHGRSGGARGDANAFSDYLDDLDAFVRQPVFTPPFPQRFPPCRETFNSLTDDDADDRSRYKERAGFTPMPSPSFAVFGHSFGGLVAIHWALRHPERLRCLILQSPLLGFGFPIPPWKEILGNVLRPVLPSLTLPVGLNPAWLSHDPAIGQRYRADPLVHGRITLRGYAALQKAMRTARARAGEVTRPTLVLHGEQDPIISLSACREFFERLTCEKRLLGFPDCYHELHHEAVLPQVVEAAAAWVNAYASS